MLDKKEEKSVLTKNQGVLVDVNQAVLNLWRIFVKDFKQLIFEKVYLGKSEILLAWQ